MCLFIFDTTAAVPFFTVFLFSPLNIQRRCRCNPHARASPFPWARLLFLFAFAFAFSGSGSGIEGLRVGSVFVLDLLSFGCAACLFRFCG